METTEQFEANILIEQLRLDATMETSGAVALTRNFNSRLTELEDRFRRPAQTPSAPAPTIVAPSVTSSAVPPVREVQTLTPEDVGQLVIDEQEG